MAFSSEVDTVINNVIEKYIKTISSKFNINEKDLKNIWFSKETVLDSIPESKSEMSNLDDMSPERLTKCTKPELQALCKKNGKPVTGTKMELMSRLLGKENNVTKVEPEKKEKKSIKNELSRKSQSRSKLVETLVSSLSSSEPVLSIRKNNFGNYEHPETRIVFNDNKIAIGVQNDDGTIIDLSEEDIENCKKFKFKYEIPENLDKKAEILTKKDDISDIQEKIEKLTTRDAPQIQHDESVDDIGEIEDEEEDELEEEEDDIID